MLAWPRMSSRFWWPTWCACWWWCGSALMGAIGISWSSASPCTLWPPCWWWWWASCSTLTLTSPWPSPSMSTPCCAWSFLNSLPTSSITASSVSTTFWPSALATAAAAR
ncbi:hypothetical protein F5883DRAFT_539430 [Diaporthe sp. PMI_573]|nr:hypothetical protein F5883DRAFT_539430 [Diaporthaceae sp. PMI_573]